MIYADQVVLLTLIRYVIRRYDDFAEYNLVEKK